MTVKKLIEILETCPQEATVFAIGYNGDRYTLETKDIHCETIDEMLQYLNYKHIDENCRKGTVTIGLYD